MAKFKYKFNPDTLSYDQINKSFKKKLISLLPHTISVIFVSIIITLLFTSVIDSPKYKRLNREYSQLITQYNNFNEKLDNIKVVVEDIEYRDDNIYRSLFSREPIPSTVRNAGIGGVNRYSNLEGFNNSELVISTAKKLDKIQKKLVVQSVSFDDITELSKNKKEFLECAPAIQPIAIDELTRFASGFGRRLHPVYRTIKMHTGIDLTAPRGTDIHASGDGVVELVKNNRSGYGKEIVVNHGFGYKTRYAHLSKFLVKKGQKIKRGEILGLVGNTGTSTGPHLHYEVVYKGKKVNPIHYYFRNLTPKEYNEIIKVSSRPGQSLD